MLELQTTNQDNLFPEFGLGIEHFVRKSGDPEHLSRDENIKRILDDAYNIGIRHFDIVFNYPHFFSIFREFINHKREKITFTTHIGQVFDENTGKSRKVRSLKLIKDTIYNILNDLDINYIDIGILQYITNLKDYQTVKDRKILKLMYDLQEEGIIRTLGVSGHSQKLLHKIITQDDFETIMFPINFSNGYLDDTKELIDECRKQNLTIMAIKTLLHGKAFTTKKMKYSKLVTTRNSFDLKLQEQAQPYQCFNYVLQCGADKIIFGVTNTNELIENISNYIENRENVDYDDIVNQFKVANVRI